MSCSLHWNRGSSASLCLSLGKGLFIKVSTLFSISKMSLSLAELGQIESSNFFGLFNLLLVSFDLGLKLINQSLHAFMILSVLISSISQLFNSSLRFAKILGRISKSTVFSINF